MQVSRSFGQFASIHVRHHYVSQEEPDLAGVLLEIAQGLSSVPRGPGLVAQCTDHSGGDRARCLLVINDEDRGLCRKLGPPLSSRGHTGSWQCSLLPVPLPTKRG